MEASDTDSSFSFSDSDSDLENLYDSECDNNSETIDHETAVSGWLFEPLRPENYQENDAHTAATSSEASVQIHSRIGTIDW